MKKFVVLYRSPITAMEQMRSATPAQSKAGMDEWMTWNKKAGKTVVDLGAPLGDAKAVKANGAAQSIGGGAAGYVTGYSIMQADSAGKLEAALKGHPHFKVPGASIEVLEVMQMPGT
jgi:hypothetical protein